MSNNDKNEATEPSDKAPDAVETATPGPDTDTGAEAGHIETPAADPLENPHSAPEPEAKPARKGGGVAWLALLLALIALASGGYLVVEDWRQGRLADASSSSLSSAIAQLESRVDASAETLANLDRNLGELAAANGETVAELDALQQDLGNRLNLLDSLAPRLSTVENSLASLQGISTGARDTWLVAEAEYYMQIANAQLQLAGNPDLAALALGMADERVAQLADPALTEVRRTIADELAALEVMDKPDIEGVTLTLASLARVVGSLPLRHGDADDSEEEPAQAPSSGMERAWNSVKDAVSGLIKVTPPDQASLPLVPPEAAYFLRTNLALQLQSARLSLLRGEQAVFEQSLDDASAWLTDYFDTDSAQVSGALQTISEIRGGFFSVTAPDISVSLRLLRQYKTLAETSR